MNRTIRALAALSALALIQCGGGQKVPETPPNEIPAAEPAPTPSDTMDAGVATSGPANPGAAADTTTPAAAMPSAADPTTAATSLSDPQIAAITEAANSAEIAQAKLALSKSKNPDVKRFAEMMIKHHGEAKKKQAKLQLTPVESPDSSVLEANASSTLDSLKQDPASDFDQAYMDAQVQGHQKVLATINDKLLPNVKSPDLKAYLDEIKPRVEQHLKEAKSIQRGFESKHPAAALVSKHSG